MLGLLQSLYSQTEFQKMVDASATKLPYDDYSINKLKNYLTKNLKDNFGWNDEVIWVKGIVRNMSFGAIDGKCGTKKGEVFYYRTVISDESILWDTDGFSQSVVQVAEKYLAERKENVDYYLDKLSAFDDTLYNSYKTKYDLIAKNYKNKLENLNSDYSKYLSYADQSELDFVINKVESSAEYYLDKISDVIFPIDMYSSDFSSCTNCEQIYFELISQAISEAEDYDKDFNKSIMSEDDFNDLLLKKRNELSLKKHKSDSVRAIKKEISDLNSNMQDRIVNLLPIIKDRKIKKLVKDKYSSCSEEQKQFFDKWIEPYSSYPPGTFDYSYGIIPSFRAELLVAKDDLEKLQILRYWDRNLNFWENALTE